MRKMADGGEAKMSVESQDHPFSLFEEGDNHFLVKGDGGVLIPVAKGALSPEQQDKIRSFPSVGGAPEEKSIGGFFKSVFPTPSDFGTSNAPNPQASWTDFLGASGKNWKPSEQQVEAVAPRENVSAVPPQPSLQPGQTDQQYMEPVPMPVVPQIPQPLQIPQANGFDPYFNQQAAGIKGLANAQAEGQRKAAEAAAALQQTMKETQNYYAEKRAALDAEQAKLENDYKNGSIDPSHFWNKQTGIKGGVSRVLSMVGLFLGGMGELKAGHNPAQVMLQDAINKDIDAQKEQIDKNKNLLSMNYRKYGDLQQAEQATKLDMMNMFSAQLQQYAAQTNSEAIKKQAEIQLGQLGLQKEALKNEMAKKEALNKLISNPGGVSDAALSLLPKEQVGLMVRVGPNQNVPARSEKDAQELKDAEPAINNVIKLIDELDADLRSGKVGTALFGDLPLAGDFTPMGREGRDRQQELAKAISEAGSKMKVNEFTDENYNKRLIPNVASLSGSKREEFGDLQRLKSMFLDKINQARSSRLMTYDPANAAPNFKKGLAK